jgi:hypothetical protein
MQMLTVNQWIGFTLRTGAAAATGSVVSSWDTNLLKVLVLQLVQLQMPVETDAQLPISSG